MAKPGNVQRKIRLVLSDVDGTLLDILRLEEFLKADFPELSIVRSADFLLEIMRGGITKSTAVRELGRQWDIPAEQTAAFGDHFNDADMLRVVGEPWLMDNAPAEMKREFGNVTASNDEEGIYKALVGMGLIPEI